jgi:hypothetical protein
VPIALARQAEATSGEALSLVHESKENPAMDHSSRQLLLATFAYLLAIGGVIAALGAAFASS